MPKRIKSSNAAKAVAMRDMKCSTNRVLQQPRISTEYSVFLHDHNGALIRTAVIS